MKGNLSNHWLRMTSKINYCMTIWRVKFILAIQAIAKNPLEYSGNSTR